MNNEFENNSTQTDLDSESESLTAGPFLQSWWLRLGLGLLGVIVILVLAGPGLRDRLFTRGGSADVSLTELEQAVATDPDNDALQYELAGAYYRAHRFDDAWAQFRAVEAYRLASEARPEITDAEQAVQAAPQSKEAHFKLGTAWAQAQLLTPAEIAFQAAIALDGHYVDAHANLGVVYYQMGRLADALREYDAALTTNPDDADVHHNRGAVYVQQALQVSPPNDDLLDQAFGEFQRALELDSNLPQAYFSLGVVYTLRDQPQEAIAEFQRFLELDDGSDPEATTAAQNYLTQLGQQSE
jgi:tetratricopeptide (TPR) repeat protein